MKTNHITTKMTLKAYNSPEIQIIHLDNEISLALESAPPAGPDELVEYNQLNPYKDEKKLT